MASSSRIPVTLLAGFLGSGKTTLVNRILSTEHGQRVAVIVNEFGDVGIDGRLIQASSDDVVELANGCICCTVREDLTETLTGMLRRSRRRFFASPKFDRVLIEASGMASPGPSVQTLLAVQELADAYELEGIVTLAHAQHVEEQLREHPEAAEQIGYADLLLLNHADRVDEAFLQRAEAAVRDCNGEAKLLRTRHADVDVETLLQTHARRPQSWQPERWDDGPPRTRHTSGVTTIALRSTAPLDYVRFKTWMNFLLGFRKHQVLRMKGILRCHPHEVAVVVQGIYQWVEIHPGADAPPDESVLVLIGRNLDREKVQKGWEASHLREPR
jgi:G3E family GTPase